MHYVQHKTIKIYTTQINILKIINFIHRTRFIAGFLKSENEYLEQNLTYRRITSDLRETQTNIN